MMEMGSKHNMAIRKDKFVEKVVKLILGNLLVYGTNTVSFKQLENEFNLSKQSVSYHIKAKLDELAKMGITVKTHPQNYKCKLLVMDIQIAKQKLAELDV